MNYYNFHIGDFRSGTINMSRQSRWIYRDMLDIYYDTEQPLPLDIEVLCDMLGIESEEDIKLVEKLLRFKFVKTDYGYTNSTCVRVIAEYHLKADTAKENGKRGGRPKNPKEPTGFQSGFNPVSEQNQIDTGLQANHKPLTTNQEPSKTKTTVTATDDFSKFWDAYPKKTGKTEAQKSWLKNKPPIDLILKALAWQSCSEQWRKDGGQFVPNPATYLNQGRWQDEPIQLTRANVNESFNDQAREGARARLFGVQANGTS